MTDDEIDPLDAYMASLCVPSAADANAPPSALDEAVASSPDWTTVRHWRRPGAASSTNHESQPQNDIDNVTGNNPSARVAARDSNSSAAVKNRRYRRMQQLLQGEKVMQDLSQPGAMEANHADWYFSDTMMQQRNPALFHFHLGQYLPGAAAAADASTSTASSVQTAAATTSTNATNPELLLSSFLLNASDRREMEARRTVEQTTWSAFTAEDEVLAAAREQQLFEEDATVEEEEEEESDDDSSDEETKRSDSKEDVAVVEQPIETLTIAERREALVELMMQRFLSGCDAADVDYRVIDTNAALDDLDQMQRDAEDAYFARSDSNSDSDDK